MLAELHAKIARELASLHTQEKNVNDPTEVLTDSAPPPVATPSLGRKVVLDTMNLRELYCGLALQGVLASHSGETALPDAKKAAKWSREYADALLIELSNTPSA